MNAQPELFARHPDEPTTSLEEERRAREQEAKRATLKRMKSERREWLDRMEAELARVYDARVLEWGEGEAYVTADDGRHLIKAYPTRFALPAGASMKLMGALFRGSSWVRSEHRDHTSSTEGSHGNDLYLWRHIAQRQQAVA